MKIPYLLILVISVFCHTLVSCSDNDMEQIESRTNLQTTHSDKSLRQKRTDLNMQDSVWNTTIDSIIAHSRENDSIMADILNNNSAKARYSIIATVEISHPSINGVYFCTVGYKGVYIHYETKMANFFPPTMADGVDVTFEIDSAYKDITLESTSYREVERTDGYCMVRVIVLYKTSGLLGSEYRAINLGLVFEGRAEAHVYDFSDSQRGKN